MNKRSAANGYQRANEDLRIHIGPGFWDSELHCTLEKRDETMSTSTHVATVACRCSRHTLEARLWWYGMPRMAVIERSATSQFRVLNKVKDGLGVKAHTINSL